MAAKRYTDVHGGRAEGITLLLAHGAGTHKEHWEPMLERLFDTQHSKPGTLRIREAWAFDWQSHGDSAVLNRGALDAHPRLISISEWAQALVAFVNSKFAVHHRIVVIGHSSGASAWLYTTKFFPFRIPYISMIIVEPMLADSGCSDESGMIMSEHRLIGAQGWWPSNEAVHNFSSSNTLSSTWDTRALSLYSKYGTYTEQLVPTSARIVPKCNIKSENGCYLDIESTLDAMGQIAKVCQNVPIHAIFGERSDVIPRRIQDSAISSPTGRQIASVTRIRGAGHMVLQEQPDVLANHIAHLFDRLAVDFREASMHL
ncbi:alpha/beta-hydrolase [Athelia psychrophila]|uniref:Alpha/beta-hydrolase n=1 Tax=Athelia psychrophila TaxID=1759441 RepID=A0A165YZN3_9AGAM|nr:alpha/beta-hydrolase [Fibularhizoctonia sp. CBS 109695]